MKNRNFRLKLVACGAAIAALIGCASVPPDLGRTDVDELVGARGLPVDSGNAAALIEKLLGDEMSPTDAVRIALVNNPDLGAAYAELGLGAADVYAAVRISNPVFSAAMLDSNRAGEQDLKTFGLLTSFTDLLTLRSRARNARADFEATKRSIAARVVATAAETERLYFDYVASRQLAAIRRRSADAAELEARLAEEFLAVGNMTQREFEQRRAAGAEARIAALAAAASAQFMRAGLANQLGVRAADDWGVPPRLPLPSALTLDRDALVKRARSSRLDLAAARERASMLAERRGATGWQRWADGLAIGAELERETDGARLKGPSVDWDVPIFSQGRDRLLRLDAELETALIEVARLANVIDNAVQSAHAAVVNAGDRAALYRDVALPARTEATRQAQLEQNFMLIGVFDVLESKQREFDVQASYVEAVREYWLARAELAAAVGNSLPETELEPADLLGFDAAAAGDMPMHDHSMDGGAHNSHGEKP